MNFRHALSGQRTRKSERFKVMYRNQNNLIASLKSAALSNGVGALASEQENLLRCFNSWRGARDCNSRRKACGRQFQAENTLTSCCIYALLHLRPVASGSVHAENIK